MASLSDFRDLETADINIDYTLLDSSFWNSVSDMVHGNHLRFMEEERAITPTREDLHRAFSL